MAHKFKLTRRVEFVDTDVAGIMHFSNFFRYMEQIEHAFLRSLDTSVHQQTTNGFLGFPRVHASCDYKTPLRFEDEVEVHLLVRKKDQKRMVYDFVFRNMTNDPPVEAARGSLTVVCAGKQHGDGALQAMPIPADVAAKIEAAPAEALK